MNNSALVIVRNSTETVARILVMDGSAVPHALGQVAEWDKPSDAGELAARLVVQLDRVGAGKMHLCLLDQEGQGSTYTVECEGVDESFEWTWNKEGGETPHDRYLRRVKIAHLLLVIEANPEVGLCDLLDEDDCALLKGSLDAQEFSKEIASLAGLVYSEWCEEKENGYR